MLVDDSDLTVKAVQIAKPYDSKVKDMVELNTHELIIDRASVHIITTDDGNVSFHVYTDDGKGNGDHIISTFIGVRS